MGTQWVERPATVCIPLMFAAWASGNGSKVYRSDFYEVPGDAWLKIYWFLFCAMLIYLLSVDPIRAARPAASSTAPAHRDRVPGARRCRHRGLRRPDRHPVVFVVRAGHGGLVVDLRGWDHFRVAAARSWRNKTRWFKRRPDPDSPRRTPAGR